MTFIHNYHSGEPYYSVHFLIFVGNIREAPRNKGV